MRTGSPFGTSLGFKQPDPGHFEFHRLGREGLRRLGLFPDLLLDVAQLLILPLLVSAFLGPLLPAVVAPFLDDRPPGVGVAHLGESVLR